MNHFSSSLNRPLKFKTAQGSGSTPGRLPLSSTIPVVAYSLIATAGVLPVVAGSPAPPIGQDWDASGQFAHVSSQLLSSAQTIVNMGRQPANDSLQRKRKRATSSENNV